METPDTANRALELLSYDPDTGNFTWKTVRRGKGTAGKPAGSIHPHGYVRICIDRRLHNAHRIAWVFITGSWPKSNIDHIDGDRANNKACNLRESSQQQNCFNRSISRANKSGYKGVSLIRRTGKWGAWIKINGKSINLGTFESAHAASTAYKAASQKLYGEFAKT